MNDSSARLCDGKCLGRVRSLQLGYEAMMHDLLIHYRYKQSQTIHGLPQPAGLRQCERLPAPIYTPSTKAELGEKDVNITPDEARSIVGDKYASQIEELVLACYKAGAAYAEEHGILIVADLRLSMFMKSERLFLAADHVSSRRTPSSKLVWMRRLTRFTLLTRSSRTMPLGL